MISSKNNLFFIMLFFATLIIAAEPTGYYNTAEGKNGAVLKSALFLVIQDPDVTSYGGLLTSYQSTDRRSDGYVWDMYSDIPNGTPPYFFTFGYDQCGNYSGEGDCYNREHSMPQSWFNQGSPMRSDLFHVYPTDGYVNGRRGSYPFGEVANATWTSQNGSKVGSGTQASGYTGTVFEPIDEYKGDFARTYFYMATCYENKIQNWAGNGTANTTLAGNSYPVYKTWVVDLLLKWHRNDPVSAKEKSRNDAVYNIQDNRNPYIDYPELAEHVWGNMKDVPFYFTNNPRISLSPGGAIDFGKIQWQQQQSKQIALTGYNLTGNLSLSISEADAQYFSVVPQTISAAEAAAGKVFTITYSANVVGVHNAVLEISGGGISNTTINITAQSSDGFIALEADNITSDSFRANWTSSSGATGYLLDVYTIVNAGTGTQTLLQEDFDNGLPATWSKSGYINTTEVSGSIRLGSNNNNGVITTPNVNLSIDDNILKVNAKRYGSDATAILTASIRELELAQWHTGANYEDFSVEIPQGTSSAQISLSVQSGGGNRVYISSVTLETLAENTVRESISGYPQSVGNILYHTVTGLQANSNYYYTIQPEGNSEAVSNEISVRTSDATSLKNTYFDNIILTKNMYGQISVLNATPNTVATLYDISGRVQGKFRITSSEFVVPISQKGIYFLRLGYNQQERTLKIIY